MDYKDHKLKIFGETFEKNNENKLKIIYKNKEYNLVSCLNDIDKDCNTQDVITIELKNINNIIDI